MAAIFPIPTGRTSDLLTQQRLLAQLHQDQLDIFRLQDQLSSGRRITLPSQDPHAATRAITLQRILEQKGQARTNLDTSNSYLAATDNALSGVADLLADVRGQALSAVDSTLSAQQRQAIVQTIQQAIGQLADVANQEFRGRYLFAGSTSNERPFTLGLDQVVYHGNDGSLQSFADVDLLFQTNASGTEVFGATSAEIKGTADLNPRLTAKTRLSDLHGGAGIQRGSFIVSDGTNSSTIDISSAETIGDVAKLIEANPPAGRELTVTITDTGLTIQIDAAGGGNLTIREAGGTTAKDLSILETAGTGIAPIVGGDLDPRLRLTTRLSDLPSLSDLASGIQIVNGGETFTITFDAAETVEDVLNTINGSGANVLAQINAEGTGVNVRSRLSGTDFFIGENGGTTATELGIRSLTGETYLSDLNHGRGVATADGTDFTIRRRDGTELEIDVSAASTIGDVLDLINSHPANLNPATAVVARLASFGNGIELVDANAAGSDTLTITKAFLSQASWDLGLVAHGEDAAVATIANPQILTGSDVNPQETNGVFNTLIRLKQAIADFDLGEIERAVEMLDVDLNRVSFARAELGARQQGLEVLEQRLEAEEVELRNSLSLEIDTDFVDAVSQLSAQQASLEASLRMIARTFQTSLLNFL